MTSRWGNLLDILHVCILQNTPGRPDNVRVQIAPPPESMASSGVAAAPIPAQAGSEFGQPMGHSFIMGHPAIHGAPKQNWQLGFVCRTHCFDS